jgi:Tol biopolymer transport system component
MVVNFRFRFSLVVTLFITLVLSAACTAAYTPDAGTVRVSQASDGTQADNRSKQPSISADGRYIAFASDATNLVAGDNNGVTDIFVRDMSTGAVTRVSVSSNGDEANGASYWPFISANGRYVTFTSEADNLAGNDNNGFGDVFLHDMKTKTTELISVGFDGNSGNELSFWSSVSTDGQFVVFMSNATSLVTSDTNEAWDIFLRDRKASKTSIISLAYDGSQANSQSEYPMISANGRYVVFASDATNIVGNDTNGYRDVFEYDRATGKTIRVSLASDGTQTDNGTHVFAMSISEDGKYVAFASLATTLVPDDTNGVWDIFVHDRDTGKTTRISVASNGTQADAGSYGVSLSANGRYVAFGSNATNLVSGDKNGVMDVYVHDIETGTTQLVSTASDGSQGNEASGFTVINADGIDLSYGPAISSDGKTVVYMSNATNLVPDDTNTSQDIFATTH